MTYKNTAGSVCIVQKSLCFRDLEEAVEKIALYKYDRPELLDYKVSWFEKLMNKLGWYKKTTVYVIDKQWLYRDMLNRLYVVKKGDLKL